MPFQPDDVGNVMTNRQKQAAWIAGPVVLALFVYLLVLPALFDGEAAKALAIEKARTEWSRELSIGALSLHLRPFPELHATDVKLANPPWAGSKHLLSASTIVARLELLALIQGKARIKSLFIDEMNAHLEVSPNGAKSWDLRTADNPKTSSTGGDAGRLDFIMHLNAVRLRNAEIVHRRGNGELTAWRFDEISGMARAGLRNVRINAGLRRDRHPLRLQARFDDLSQLGKKGSVTEGSIDLRWDSSHLEIDGNIPLEANLHGQNLRLKFSSDSFADVLGFFGADATPTAALKAGAALTESQGRIIASDLAVELGKLKIAGDARLTLSEPKPVIDARLAADHVDWHQTLKDAGRPPAPPPSPDELFSAHPLAWKALLALERIGGSIEARIARLELPSGLQMNDVKTRLILKGEQTQLTGLSASLLGGSMSGNVSLNGRRQNARINLDANNISLAQWFAERGKEMNFSGGPMNIKASVSASGSSMKQLAASLTGPVSISMGPAVIASERARDAENLLTGISSMFSGSDAGRIDLQCVGAQLPFKAGRAVAEPIVGARSSTSQLLTAGIVDLRAQVLDLRGRVRPVSGISLGVSTFAGEVRIAGRLNRPEFGLDPGGAPEALARLGAALATGGMSILGTAIWDAVNATGDPCAIASAARKSANPTN
jgi:uncharacterized protein involved in outer membrane biogenesis